MTDRKRKIAFWFRYSPADHAELYPAMPQLIKDLSQYCEVHYFATRSAKPLPPLIEEHAILHLVPFRVNRASTADKIIKLILWYLFLPITALRCRFLRIDILCINDYQPLAATTANIFYGGKVVSWVADFLHNVYADETGILKPIARIVDALDLAAWRKAPLLFTMVKSTQQFLAQKGINPSLIVPIHDSCDLTIYRPIPRENERAKWSFTAEDIVLGHHGILHPNKGLDRIIRGLEPLMNKYRHLKFFIIGSGPELENLKNLSITLGIDRSIIFTGWLKTTEEVNAAINAADISLVMRSGNKYDNFHATSALTHSMAAGQPILSARLGGISEIIKEGINGFLFDPSDMSEFRSKLTVLMNEPDLRRQFGESALTTAKELFNINSVASRTAAPILKLLP